MTTVTITETSNAVTVDDENVQVVDVRVVNTATTTSAGLMSANDKTKLDGIESSADVTDATNVEAAGAVMETDTSTTDMQFVVDEDNMASDSATKIPTQQSVKAYVDSQISSKDELSELSGDLDDISDGTNHVKMTNAERTKLSGIETGATADQSDAEIKIAYENNANTNAFTDAEQTKLSGIETGATADQSATEIKSLYESNSDTNAFTDSEQTKLSGIENNATADQTDSEIRTLVDSATDSNVFTDADHTKLDGIEANATADQTDAEIKAAYENNSDTNAFTDAEQTKLSGIETNATADQSASEILTAIKTVDGATSGLDADLLDGQEGSYYQQASTALNTSTSFGGDVSGTYDAIVVADDSHNHVISNVDGLQTALDAKAPLASPALTGTPTAPTAAVDDSTTKIATTAFVQQELAQLVDSAPSTLDTLNEIAAAINDDANFNTTVTNSLANRLRVDTAAQGLTSTQQNNAKTNLGLDDVASSGAYSDLTGTPSNATTSTDGLMSSSDKTKLDAVEAGATADQTASEIKTAYESNANTNAFTDAQQTKLAGIETNSTADQTDAEIKTAYENNADTNAFTDAEKTKLSGIESNATGDQTASEILTSIKTVDGATSGLDADVLDGQEGTYYLNYNNFTNTPTIPTNNNELTNGAGYITSADGGNAQTLDSLDSTQFLRSDADDNKTSGSLTFEDNIKARFGTSGDLQIYHDGSNSFINDVGTGSVVMRTNGSFFQFDTPSTVMAKFIKDGAVELRHNNNLKFSTASTGATVTGELLADDIRMNGGSSSDFRMTSADGTEGYKIRSNVSNTADFGCLIEDLDGNDIAKFLDGGECLLTHNHSTKFQTTSTGATVTGVLVADGLDIAKDTDASAEIGRAHIGNVNHGDFAGFSHVDQNFSGNYALLQGSTGATFLNAASGQTINHRINNSTVMQMDSSGLDITGDLTLTSTDDGATENPTLDLYRNSASPADADLLGEILFSGENDADEKIQYAQIKGTILDNTDGTEDGELRLSALTSGSNQIYQRMTAGLNILYQDIVLKNAKNIQFEGATDDAFETTLTVTDPTADRTITLPDATGTVALQEQAYQSINAQTGTTYTTVLTDGGKLVTLSNASAITLTIPPNSSVAYPVGTKLDFIQIGAGQVTVAGGTGVTVNSTPTLKFRAQHSGASCIKIATDTWQLVGDLAAS